VNYFGNAGEPHGEINRDIEVDPTVHSGEFEHDTLGTSHAIGCCCTWCASGGAAVASEAALAGPFAALLATTILRLPTGGHHA
jgi:hypothetical protein